MPPTTPRQFQVPKALCSSGFGPTATLDEMELLAPHRTPAGQWSRQVLTRENAKLLDELLGDDTKLPVGVLASGIDEEVVVALRNWKGEVWDGHGWQPDSPLLASAAVELDEGDVAFFVRAMREGAAGMLMRAYVPTAFIPGLTAAGEEAQALPEVPEGGIVVAIVDPLDKNAVLEVLAVAPGPKVFRRNDGQWHEDAAWVQVLKSVKPPAMAKLEGVQASSVISQVDQATAGADFEPFEADDREKYVPSVSASAQPYIDELRRETDDRLIALTLGIVAVAGRELSPKDAANTEKLRRYWLWGPGAAKIRWGQPGSWRRCHRNLLKYLGPKMTPGYCTNLSKRLGGPGIATHVGSKRG